MKKLIAALLLIPSLAFGVPFQYSYPIFGTGTPGSENPVTSTNPLPVSTTQGSSTVSATNTAVTVTNSSTAAIAANTARKYLQIQNNDSAGIIYCTPTAAATTANGVKLQPGQTWAPYAPPTNAINCIGSIASNANVVVTEGQ